MLLSALSFLVVAQSSSEVPERLMNNPVLPSHLRPSSRWSLFFRFADQNPACIFLLLHSCHKRRQFRPPPSPTQMTKLSIEGKKFFFYIYILIHVVEQTWPSIMLPSSKHVRHVFVNDTNRYFAHEPTDAKCVSHMDETATGLSYTQRHTTINHGLSTRT